MIEEILDQRGERYGDFDDHAELSQALKELIRNHDALRYNAMSADKKEALEMIMHKVTRIINGDANHKDSWVDIAGYSMLVANTL